MNNILNIIKKELDKIFRNPRLIISTFLLPGLLIFVMYSLMGSSAKNQTEKSFSHEYQIVMLTESNSMKGILENLYYDESSKFNVKITQYETTLNKEQILEEIINPESTLYQTMRSSLKNEETDIWIYVDEKLDNVLNQVEGTSNVYLYTHTNNTFSTMIGSTITTQLNAIQNQINPNNKYVIQSNVSDMASEEEVGSTFLAMMAPMLIMTFIFAGALSIGADSIAGEKERGTIATMLMAPISKNQIVLGKIFSAIIITIVASICSFIGLMAALGQFAAVMGESGNVVFHMDFVSCVELLVMILLISLIAVSLFLVASTFAKSTKEATMYAMPVYILGIVSGVFTMFEMGVSSNILPYLIPIYNLTLGLKGIFINNLGVVPFLVIVGSNLIYFSLILIIVKKMFGNERIMFSK